MAGIGVVFNPKSRRNLRDPTAAERLARLVGDHGIVRSARSIEELTEIAREFRRAGIDVLAISGGDGTNTVTLTGFIDAYGKATLPPIALLRGGTMNTVANSIGAARGTPEELLSRLVSDYAHRDRAPLTTVERHVLRVEPQPGGPHHYGFLFGTGVVQGFLAEYYGAGEPTPLVAAETLARGIASAFVGGRTIRRMAKPFRGSAVLGDGTHWGLRDYLAIAAGTVAHIGLTFKPFYRFDERPGTFHALGIYASPAAFVTELSRIHRGLPMMPHHADDAVTSHMLVSSASGPLKFMIDGDLHEAAVQGPDDAHGFSRGLPREGIPGSSPAEQTSPPVRGGVVAVSAGPRVRLVVTPRSA